MTDRPTTPAVRGIHHVTAIGGDPQRMLDFHVGTLGLRLVKRTVNFDDPSMWHFYFGDATGTPGSLLTLFPMPGAAAARPGHGQVAVTQLAVPAASIGWWVQRLVARGVAFEGPTRRLGETVLALRDPDGLALELVGDARAGELPGWDGGPVPAEHAVRGVHGVTLWLEDTAPTAALLAETLGYREGPREGTTARWLADGDPVLGRVVDLRDVGGFWNGAGGVGGVHHVAFRVADDAAELALREAATRRGRSVTTVRDRQYFRSVYFREPGGVLFELATDGPGFLVDEPADALGAELRLPPAYESRRAAIAAALPAVEVEPYLPRRAAVG